MNSVFLKILILDTFVKAVIERREILLDELKTYGCDPVRRMRRIRMLSQLAYYESETIKKINDFESDDIDDWLSQSSDDWLGFQILIDEIDNVIDRSA